MPHYFVRARAKAVFKRIVIIMKAAVGFLDANEIVTACPSRSEQLFRINLFKGESKKQTAKESLARDAVLSFALIRMTHAASVLRPLPSRQAVVSYVKFRRDARY